MKVYEIGTGYTPIPATMGAATEIVVEELTRAFRKQNVPVEIIDIKASDRKQSDLPISEVWVPGCFTGTDVKLGIMHKLKRVVYSVCLAQKLKNVLKKSPEKVVLHFHNQYNMFFFLKFVPERLRKKAVLAYTVHSYIWPDEWEKIRETVHKRYFQEIFCVQNADCVFVLNQKTAENFTTHLGVSSERIYRIDNGVNTDVYLPLRQQEKISFAEKTGLQGKKMILQVGSVCERKNQLTAVQMLKEYLRKHQEVVYAYAGGVIDAEYQEKIKTFAEQNAIAEQVRYLGELTPGEELNLYYNLAGVTVFPSKLEAFGLVIIESIAAGTPVLMPSEPLFSIHNGVNIYTSEETFVKLIDHCLNDEYSRESVRNEAVASYGWDKVSQECRKIWEK
ncbi:MAG: glycosyltransferase family 4 protein [Clostridia bacterium]|nr:glycosyltransferase family 4 protein [Clostridia bacterium]